MTIAVDAPTRFAFEAKPLGGKDIRAVGQNSSTSQQQIIISLVHGCHTITTATGYYNFVKEGDVKPQWSKMSWADLMYGLIEIRRASFPMSRAELGFVDRYNMADERPVGDILDFDFVCQAVGCRKLVEWTIDLKSYVEKYTRRIDDASFEKLSHEQELDAETLDGVKVAWIPGTPAADTTIRELMRTANQKTETPVEWVTKHIKRVHAKERDLVAPKDIWKWAEKLSIQEIDDLYSKFDLGQPSFENEIEVSCNHEGCGAQQRITLPFGSRGFIYPRQAKQAERALREKRERELERLAKKKEQDDRDADEGQVASSGSSSPASTSATSRTSLL